MIFSIPKRLLLGALFSLAAIASSQAQVVVADKILATVGRNRIILKSELDMQMQQMRAADSAFSDTMSCSVLQQIIQTKLLVEQAERDSLLVSDEELEANLDNRIRYFTRMYGSKENLERQSGKTVYQIKSDLGEPIRENMMAERMREKILANIKITPSEVRDFFNKIPVDSLPFFPATVEVGQIVIEPPTSPELDKYAKDKLEGIRKAIVEGGESFETQAKIYSDDPGSRDEGGRMNDVQRTGQLVPEFASAAFRLKDGEISPIVKTEFGYHIIQMIRRKGDQADIRHILIKIERTASDFQTSLNKLDSVRSKLVTGSISFPEAVGKYATDAQSKMTGGMILNEQNGSAQLEVDQLDPQIALMVDSLATGAYSQPHIFVNERGERSTRIVFMKSRTEPHKANLKDDYGKIQAVALEQKKANKLDAWLNQQMGTFYIRLDDEYKNCGGMRGWGHSSAGK